MRRGEKGDLGKDERRTTGESRTIRRATSKGKEAS